MSRVGVVHEWWMAYNDGGIPVGYLGVVVYFCCADGGLAGLFVTIRTSSHLRSPYTYAASNVLQI